MLQAAEARRLQTLSQGSNNDLHGFSKHMDSKRVLEQSRRDKDTTESSKGPSLELEHHDHDPSWLLAVQLQAEFDAEAAQAREDARASRQSPHHKNHIITSRPSEEYRALSSVTRSSVESDEALARRLQAAFDEAMVPDNAYIADDSYRSCKAYSQDSSSTPVQLPIAAAHSASTGAESNNVLGSSTSLQSFAQKLARATCATCKSRLITRDFDAAELFVAWLTGEGMTPLLT